MLSIALFLSLAAQASMPNIKDNRIPSSDSISELESKITMPAGAGPLSTYDRSYTQVRIDGKDTIIGQMIDRQLAEHLAREQGKPSPPTIRRVLVDGFQPIFDGGCAIVMVMYKLGQTTPPKLLCNPSPH